MKRTLAFATLILAASCGGPKAPEPTTATATPDPQPPTSVVPPPASTPSTTAAAEPVPTTTPAATASTDAGPAPSAALDAGVNVKTDGGKVVVTAAIEMTDKGSRATSSRMPADVIAALRPQFTTCFTDGMKKDPKLAGSVTMSAKIGTDGKVSATTPKRLDGLNDAVVKCLSDKLKAAQFAAAGSPGYAASIDIPLSFSSSM